MCSLALKYYEANPVPVSSVTKIKKNKNEINDTESICIKYDQEFYACGRNNLYKTTDLT